MFDLELTMWFSKNKESEERFKYLLRIEVTFFYRLGKREKSLQRSYGVKLEELPTGDQLEALRLALSNSPLFTFTGLTPKFEGFAKNWAIIALEQLVDELKLPVNERHNLDKLMSLRPSKVDCCSKLSSCSFKFDYRIGAKPDRNDHTAIIEFSLHKAVEA